MLYSNWESAGLGSGTSTHQIKRQGLRVATCHVSVRSRSSFNSPGPSDSNMVYTGTLANRRSLYGTASASHPPLLSTRRRQMHTGTSLFRHVLNCTDLLLKVLTNGKLFVQKDFMAPIKRQLQF